MPRISNEILKIRRTRLEQLQRKYLDNLLLATNTTARIIIQDRVDELELQIASINKLLNTSLVPFSPKKKPIADVQAKKVRRGNKVEKRDKKGKPLFQP